MTIIQDRQQYSKSFSGNIQEALYFVFEFVDLNVMKSMILAGTFCCCHERLQDFVPECRISQ